MTPEERHSVDFGTHEIEHEGVKLTCRYVVPGYTMHDLTMRYHEAAKWGDDLAGNPSKWPAVMGLNAVLDVVIPAAFNAGLEEAVHIAAKEASKHKEVQHELTGPHGEAGEEAMMACASVWACEGVAAAIARARLSQKEENTDG